MKKDHEILLLIALGFFLNCYAITWGLPNINDWTNLSLAPLKPLSYAKHLLAREPWLYHYPPFHFIILTIAYSPYVLYLALTGELSSSATIFPYGLINPEISLSIFTLIARFVSIMMGVGLIIANYFAVKKFYDRGSACITAFLVATSYPIIHYSHSANVDVPQLFWFSLCLYSFVSLIDEPKTKYYVMLGLFSAFAFTTKESIYAILVGVAIVIICIHFMKAYKSEDTIINRLANIVDVKILWGLIIFLVATLLIFNPITNWEGFIFHIDRHSLRSVRGSWVIRDAPSKIQGHIELIYFYMVYILQSSGPLVFVLLASGIIYGFIKSPGRSAILIVPIICYYIFFLRIHGTYHLRYMLPIYLLLLWFAGKFSADLLSAKAKSRVLSVPLMAIVFIHSFLYGFSVNMLYVNDPRYNAEKWISENIESGSIVIAIEPEYSLPRFGQDYVILRRDLWDFHGNLIDDIKDIDGDYIVVGMSITRRRERKDEIEKFFSERGFQEIASFLSEFPVIGPVIPNLHILNPKIAILRKTNE
jgi:4-amino-4-deoxy-L-arabinose transferase-like glycosyltransferase